MNDVSVLRSAAKLPYIRAQMRARKVYLATLYFTSKIPLLSIISLGRFSVHSERFLPAFPAPILQRCAKTAVLAPFDNIMGGCRSKTIKCHNCKFLFFTDEFVAFFVSAGCTRRMALFFARNLPVPGPSAAPWAFVIRPSSVAAAWFLSGRFPFEDPLRFVAVRTERWYGGTTTRRNDDSAE